MAAGKPLDAAGGDHRTLELLRVAVVENHVRREVVDALLVTVKLVRLNHRRPLTNIPFLNAASSKRCSESVIFSGSQPISATPGQVLSKSTSSDMPPPKSPKSDWR